MSFKEADRHVSHDNSTHIHSVAYMKAENFLRRWRALERAHEEVEHLNSCLHGAQEAMKSAQKEMLDALLDHYDGAVPDYISFSGDILFIKPAMQGGEVNVIRPASYSDLYRIEPAATADAGAVDEA
ncbi:hypothetical protein [Thauera butanivorans]|uniref:hypothetical protein n=1 Tax=Thauera butanivorans TaxID=86174 RepID=UPI000837D16E|nr:hypothetical protein [Thauera butanivorans]